MKCPKCNTELNEGSKFCSTCGAKIENVCPQCGNKVSSTENFCSICGYNLKQNTENAFNEKKTSEQLYQKGKDAYDKKILFRSI